jgi:hypothetical protein
VGQGREHDDWDDWRVDDDRADRQEPDFPLRLGILGRLISLVDPLNREGAGEAQQQDACRGYGDQVN